MKRFFIILLILYTSVSNLKAQWVNQFSGTTLRLYSVYFVNENTGWAVGGLDISTSGIILKTNNGGLNWYTQYSLSGKAFVSVKFINENTGWTVGGGSGLGVILKTDNGGLNWFNPTSEIFGNLSSISFLNQNTGWAVLEYPIGKIIKTTNGGGNWFNQYTGNPLQPVFFLDKNTGWAGGFDGSQGIMIHTTNAGENWTYQTINIIGGIGSVFFINQNTGWAVGYNNIIKSTNGGLHWFALQYNFPYLFPNHVFFTDENNGWVVGGFDLGSDTATIINTTNGGSNWSIQFRSQPHIGYHSAFFLNSNTGWVVGGNGTILRTTNGGGLVGISETNNLISKYYFIHQNYPNPFNPTTHLEFGIPDPGFVTLKVYDVLGNEVKTLVNENKPAGRYTVTFDGSNLSSGIYFYKLQAGEFNEVKKMTLLK